MLALSSEVATVVTAMVRNTPDVSDETGGLRLFIDDMPDDRRSLVAVLVDHPELDDEVVETEGARVFVAPDLGVHLAEKRLATSSTDGRIAFRVEDDPS